jgi:hypothetical protein
MKYLVLAGLLFLAPAPALAQFRIPIPRIPGVPTEVPIPIPGLNNVLSQEPAISTSIADAQTEVSLLDDYTPQQLTPLQTSPRGENGSFVLAPGEYELDAQSYCLHAGTYAPGRGDGYLYAPLKGQREEIIRHILQRSVEHPTIPQHDIQVLIWSILAHTKVNDLSPEIRDTANQLLTRGEISRLNGGALGLIPDGVRQQAFANLPSPIQRVLNAEADLRQLLTQGSYNFTELERVAVLAGNPEPGEGSREVPGGRWSFHPGGFFVRYVPSGYSRTLIQVSVPQPITVTRDDLGRITAIATPEGDRIETTYDDTIPPRPLSNNSTLSAYAFRSIRFIHASAAQSGSPQQTEWNNTGWTAARSSASTANSASMAQGDRFTDWRNRTASAMETEQEVQAYVDGWEHRTRDRSAANMDELSELAHYRDGIEAATRGTSANRPTWIGEQQELTVNALEHAICVLEGGCNGGDRVTYDPASDVAAPANTSRQRLAQSARPYSE